MVKFASICLLLLLATHLNLELFQMDIKTTFLNGEEIYMDQPIGFASKEQKDKV